MKRPILIVIVVVVVMVILTALIYRFWFSAPVGPAAPTGALPPINFQSVPSSTLPSGEKLTIGTSQGTVFVNNFYQNPVQVNSERDALIRRTDSYDMVYFAQDSSFLITISQLPFDASRKKAEDDLLTALGIGRSDACKLKIVIAVPRWVDEKLSGRNFPLSFCGGGV